MPAELLLLAHWQVARTAPGSVIDPLRLAAAAVEWLPLTVPGTVGQAIAPAAVPADGLDAYDWWARCRPGVDGGDSTWVLRFEGLATLADVWLDGRHIVSSDNMFVPVEVELPGADLSPEAEIVVRFRALADGSRRPRPRWKTRLVADQSLRWRRTTLLGRIPGWAPGPAPVGPWRPVSLTRADGPRVVSTSVTTRCVGTAGVVDVQARLRRPGSGDVTVTATVGTVTTTLSADTGAANDNDDDEGDVQVSGTLHVPDVSRWWPHTHGEPSTYLLTLDVDGTEVWRRTVGFRDVSVDRSDDGFRLQVNGTAVFVRGACWLPIDAVGLQSPPAQLRATLEAARAGGLNMVRVTGVGIYESDDFWDMCAELGLLVWQDLMFANLDPPDTDEFSMAVRTEIDAVASPWQGRPSLAVLCGGSEVHQQATYMGAPAERRATPLLDVVAPDVLAELLPGVPYLPSSPTGGTLPTRLRAGVAHYFGVGAYRRPLDDVRSAGVRFAAECLAFATPSDRATPAELDLPWWTSGTPRDSGTDWTFEDVRDHYVQTLYGVDPRSVRQSDPQRYLDLGRAAVCEAMTAVFAQWRRPGSRCAGGIVLTLRDLFPGPGWGLLDAAGRPKAPWWALRPMLQPVAVFVTDEGLDGVAAHVVNDGAGELSAACVLEVLDAAGHVTDDRRFDVTVPARGGVSLDVEAVLDGFRDLNGAHGFGAAADGSVVVRLEPDRSPPLDAVHALSGPGRAPAELGLGAELESTDDGWVLRVRADRLAERVFLDVPGWTPSDNWFTLAPGRVRTIRLRSDSGASDRPAGAVRAVNALDAVPLR